MVHLKRILSIAVMLSALTAFGQTLAPKQAYTSDVAYTVVDRTLRFVQNSSQDLDWTFKQGGALKSITNATTALFYYVPQSRAWSVTVTGTVSGSTASFSFNPDNLATNTNTGKFDWRISVENTMTQRLAFAKGQLVIDEDISSVNTNLTILRLTTIPWASVQLYTDTATHGPYRAGSNVTFTANADGSVNVNAAAGSGGTTSTQGLVNVTTYNAGTNRVMQDSKAYTDNATNFLRYYVEVQTNIVVGNLTQRIVDATNGTVAAAHTASSATTAGYATSAGSASAVAWEAVTGKPDIVTPGALSTAHVGYAETAGTATDPSARAWAQAASNLAAAAETDPLSLQTSAWYVAHADVGPHTLILSNGTTAVLLTNGYYGSSFTHTGAMLSVIAQTSANGTNYADATQTGSAVWFRVYAYSELPGYEGESATGVVSDISVQSWTRPALVGRASDMAGQVLRVDDPVGARDVANLGYVNNAVAGVSAADWAAHEASQDVKLAGNRLWFDGRWSLLSTGAYAAVSYGAYTAVVSNRWRLEYNGEAILSTEMGESGLAVSNFTLSGNVFQMGVATNGGAPTPQYSTNLVNWAAVPVYTTSFPAATNGLYILTWTNTFDGGTYFRAVGTDTNVIERIVAHRKLDMDTNGIVLGGVERTTWPDGGSGGITTQQVADIVATSIVAEAAALTDFAGSPAGIVTNGTVTLTSAATVTVTYAAGEISYRLSVTNPSVTLTMGTGWDTNRQHHVPLTLIIGTNELRWNGASITNSGRYGWPTLTNSGPNMLILSRPAWGSKWAVSGDWVP